MNARRGPTGEFQNSSENKAMAFAESPVCCISTETAISLENITVPPYPATARHPCKESAAESPMRRMIGAYGDTGRPHAQTRKSQLGSSHCARPGARHRIRAAGHATATHGRDVYLLA